MDSIATLASLRPRCSNEDIPPLVPPPAVLRKLHRSLALQPSPGWHGTLPATKTTALHDDSTVKVKSPTPAPAVAATTTVPVSAPVVQAAPTVGYTTYAYNYPTAQQQASYRPASTTYAAYKAPPGSYYPYAPTATQQQSYYGGQAYTGTTNQQPYGATAGSGQTYPYAGSWYNQYQPGAAGSKPATPVAASTSYSNFFASATGGAANGAAPAGRPPAVANTVVGNKAPAPQAAGAWQANNYQAGVAPTLPSHLRTTQPSTPTTPLAQTAYQPQTGYYQGYQAQASATPSR